VACLYMPSIVGRRAAPNGVLRKSVGKSFEASDRPLQREISHTLDVSRDRSSGEESCNIIGERIAVEIWGPGFRLSPQVVSKHT
jgi:hypothetical protein